MKKRQNPPANNLLPSPETISAADAGASRVESLALAPTAVLENFRLSRLASAANLQKGLAAIVQQMVNELADAKVAEVLLERAKKKDGKVFPPMPWPNNSEDA